jgi:VNT family MFS transporter (synaptic vesicle glycoprotein 2)
MLLICGLANAADAVEILFVGLLGTAAQEDLQVSAGGGFRGDGHPKAG